MKCSAAANRLQTTWQQPGQVQPQNKVKKLQNNNKNKKHRTHHQNSRMAVFAKNIKVKK
jgi:hypothetical protein